MENKLKGLKGKFRVREKKQMKAGDITLKKKEKTQTYRQKVLTEILRKWKNEKNVVKFLNSKLKKKVCSFHQS